MNGSDTVTLKAGGTLHRVRFLGAGAGAGLPPFVGAYEVSPPEGGAGPREIRVALGLNFLWGADAAIDADASAERIMRTIGLLCVEAHLSGALKPDKQGVLKVRDFIGTRYPDYTSIEMFVTSLYDPAGRTARMCREDVLRCLLAHAREKRPDAEPTGPGLTLLGILAWPGKRRFYSDEHVRDALLAWETDGLTERVGERVRLRPDRLDDAHALVG